jgi:5'-3' exonuclease
MGIPSYFGHLMRNHKRIVGPLQKCDNLYLDSNSIVYDAVRNCPTPTDEDIVREVCAKIEGYLKMVQPRRVFIAFDGVPPMAKIKQQRERRYKSLLFPEPEKAGWNTLQITPGTNFMKLLDEGVRRHFEPLAAKYDFFRVSGSDEPGEGEHKIFEHVRAVPHADQRTLVYGLDSDLIMLALNHLKYGAINLLREAPAFMLKGEQLHVLDVGLLAGEILATMGADKLDDYIFMAMLLGNDFMPHFPSLNLRTNGFKILMETYKTSVRERHLFDGRKVHWPVLKDFLTALARRENGDVAREYKSRNERCERGIEKVQNNAPMLRREIEHYINPLEPGWQHRYYTQLFQTDMTPKLLEAVCEDYMDILHWNIQYYTTGCPHWGVFYQHMYPPLLADLAKFTYTEKEYPESRPMKAVDLLKTVLPAEFHHFSVQPYTPECKSPKAYWAFCTFIWESHLLF